MLLAIQGQHSPHRFSGQERCPQYRPPNPKPAKAMFVTYTDASQFTSRDKRRQVSKFAAQVRHSRTNLKWVEDTRQQPKTSRRKSSALSRAPPQPLKKVKIETASVTSDSTADKDDVFSTSSESLTPFSEDTDCIELSEEGPHLPQFEPSDLIFNGLRNDPFSPFAPGQKAVDGAIDVCMLF